LNPFSTQLFYSEDSGVVTLMECKSIYIPRSAQRKKQTGKESQGCNNQTTGRYFEEFLPSGACLSGKTNCFQNNILIQVDAIEPEFDVVTCCNRFKKLTKRTQYPKETSIRRFRLKS
jgi:hypothetical protein